MNTNQFYIDACLQLALKGLGAVSPNPLVGSILVNNERIIGQGFHSAFGAAHAEIEAIESVAERHLLKGATLYVNLEPCCHQGKTPPCVRRIISEGIKHVVFSCFDPFPTVHGRGAKELSSAGIQVTNGILAKEGILLNRRYITLHVHKRPYVILKFARSSDGFIAPASRARQQLSNQTSQVHVHLGRSQEDSILVGTTTAINDDPELNVRHTSGRSPLRIVIDKNLKVPATHKLFNNSAKTLLINATKTERAGHIEWLALDFNQDLLPQLLQALMLRGVGSLIVEGGAETLRYFIEQDLWDEAHIYHTTVKLNSGISAPAVTGEKISEQDLAGDTLITIYSHALNQMIEQQVTINQSKADG